MSNINRTEANERLDALEKEAQALRDIINKAEKPLTWPELPNRSMFYFNRDGNLINSTCLVDNSTFFHYNHGVFGTGPFYCRDREPVTRINPDGTPYEGDPRV